MHNLEIVVIGAKSLLYPYWYIWSWERFHSGPIAPGIQMSVGPTHINSYSSLTRSRDVLLSTVTNAKILAQSAHLVELGKGPIPSVTPEMWLLLLLGMTCASSEFFRDSPMHVL